MRNYRAWSSRQGWEEPGGATGFPGGQTVGTWRISSGALRKAVRRGASGTSSVRLVSNRSRRQSRGPVKGPDLESEVTIDFASAVRGATLELHPQGQVGAPVTVRIPAGADEGSRVRIAGQGAASLSGGAKGDLVLTIHVTPHAHFRREGDDLHLDLPVTIREAYHGARIKVPTVDGSVTLKVPEHTQSGAVLRLRGKGVGKKGRAAGDIYVHFLIQLPTATDPEVAKLVDELSKHQPEDPRGDIRL